MHIHIHYICKIYIIIEGEGGREKGRERESEGERKKERGRERQGERKGGREGGREREKGIEGWREREREMRDLCIYIYACIILQPNYQISIYSTMLIYLSIYIRYTNRLSTHIVEQKKPAEERWHENQRSALVLFITVLEYSNILVSLYIYIYIYPSTPHVQSQFLSVV